MPRSPQAVDPQLLLQQALAVPEGTTLQCQNQPGPCNNRLLDCRLVPLQGDVLILNLVWGVYEGGQQVHFILDQHSPNKPRPLIPQT